MITTLKYTYLLDPPKIDQALTDLYNRYQQILQNPDWESLNEARAILYFIGHIYCEEIASQAIERRLHLLKHPITFLNFCTVIDSNSSQLPELRSDKLFAILEECYNIIKKHKNKLTSGKHYLDEERFIDLYNSHNPHQQDKIREKGKFSTQRDPKHYETS